MAIRPARVAKILVSVVPVLLIASIAGQILNHFRGHDYVFGFVPLFYLDGENNIPTYFSTMLLFVSALLLAIIAWSKKKQDDAYALHWVILSAVFLLMSLDEGASLHDVVITPLRELLNITRGPLYFAWIIPGMALIVAFAVFYYRFLFSLPRRTRLLFSIAAILYVTGALGTEMVGGHHAALYGMENFGYTMLVSVEETLEMIGLIVFIYALLEQVKRNLGGIRIRIA
ncbi:MAG: hypothetical protein JSW71_21595 [Gemmatimonadota bacterium]|nr:MAG: hypothetical protein JSW71_21595 [Gemmatimonadota bacterium]